MDLQGLFGGPVPVMEKVLNLRSMEHNIMTSNIANIDTPNYKGYDLIIEEAFKSSENKGKMIPLNRTSSGHLSASGVQADGVRAKIVQAPPNMQKGNKNTVDLDWAMAKMSENNLMYNAMAQVISKKFNSIKSAISGGGR